MSRVTPFALVKAGSGLRIPDRGIRFARDSLVEGAGFELLVPLTQKSHAVWGGESPKLEAIAAHLPKILVV